MAERIGVEVTLRGAEAVIAKLREIDALGNKIDGKTYTAHIAAAQGRAADSIRKTTKALTGQQTAYRGVANNSQRAIRNADRLVKSLRNMNDFKWSGGATGVLANVKTVQNEVKRAIDGVNRSIEREHHEFRRLGKENNKLRSEMEFMSEEDAAFAAQRIANNIKERNAIRDRIGDLREEKTNLGNYNRELTNEYGRIQKVYDAQKSLNKTEAERWKSALKNYDRIAERQAAQIHSIDRMRLAGGRYMTRNGAIGGGDSSNFRRLRTPIAITNAEQAAIKAHEQRVQSLKRAYNGISGTMSRVGASMTTLGNAATRITAPFTGIMRGAAYTLGYGAVNKVTSGLSSGFERYDIMKKYGLTMANFSKKNYDAQKSIDELDKSVRGLPTGLDEIVSMAQRFTMTSGDMKQGTKLAIAANRAFLASMSTDSQKYQGMLQLQDVIGGKKMQSREWASLVASMPFAVREIGKSLGYSGKKLDKWVSKVQQGKVANKEFLKGLKRAGGKNGTLKKYADFTKNTWGAFTQNIGNAFSRMTAGVLTALDGVTKIMTKGKFSSLNSFLADSFIPAIDKTTEKVKDWISANPDKIIGFFDKLKSIDWAGFGKGMLSGINGLLEMMGKLSDTFGGDTFKIGQWMVKLNVLGKLISTLGMFTKGLAPFAGLAGVLGKLVAGGAVAGAIGKIGGLFGALAKIPSAAKAIRGAKTIKSVGKAMKGATLSWQGVASQAIGIAAIPAIAGSFLMAAKALKELESVDISWGKFKTNMSMIGSAFREFLGAAAVIGASLFALGSAGPGGWAALLSGAGGLGMIAAVSGDMILAAKGLNSIATAKIPDTKAVTTFMDSMKRVVMDMGEAGEELPPASIENAKKFAGIGGAMKSIEEIGKTIPRIAALKLEKKDIEKATESVEAMGPAIDAMKNAIGNLFGKKTVSSHETSNGRGKAGKHEVTYQKDFDMKSLKEAAESTSLVQSMMDSIILIAQSFQTFSKEMGKLKKMGDVNAISEIGQSIGLMVDEIGHIASRMNIAMGQFGEIEEAPAKFAKLNQAIQEFPKIIATIRDIGKSTTGKNAIDIDAVIQPITMGITRMVNQMNAILPQIDVLRMIGIELKMAVESIKTAFTGLNEIATIDVSGAINGITAAIAQINGTQIDVSPLVNKLNNATNRLKAAWKRLMAAYNAIKSKSKSITISVSVDVSGAVANINAAANALNAAWARLDAARSRGGGGGSSGGAGGGGGGSFHTGGYVNGKGRPIYRAKGGGVWMEPKGTDTVPAMLTPGEYVQNRKAVSYFGVGFMQKLNHLDLEGALRNLSVRASRSLSSGFSQSVTNHIDNRQNNARVNQTIYTSNPNFTFKRANKYVGAL